MNRPATRASRPTVDRAAEPFLAREALLALALVPPLVTVLIADLRGAPSLDNAAGCLLATWLTTLVVGLAVHAVVSWTAPRLLRRDLARPVAVAGIAAAGAAAVVASLAAFLPRLGALSPHVRAGVAPFVGPALALATLYVLLAWGYARVAGAARRAADSAREHARVALEARLAALQARTNPHFLFNTLNAIASLIPVDADLAERMVERLAGVLQYSLASGARGVVSLGEELAAVRDYLDIEQARFGPRLRARIDVAPGLDAVAIPPMLLQPLVENAVLHGLAGRARGGEVVVSGRRERDAVVLTVSDDGVGPGGSARVGTQTGLRGARERLALMYGDAAGMEVRARAGGGFECELRVPRGAAA